MDFCRCNTLIFNSIFGRAFMVIFLLILKLREGLHCKDDPVNYFSNTAMIASMAGSACTKNIFFVAEMAP